MLRDVLFDELDALRNGSADPKRAQAVAKLAQQIISTAKVEMDFHKLQMRAETMGKDLVLGSMGLGQRAAPAVEVSQTRQVAHRESQTQASDGQVDRLARPQSTSTE